MSDRPPPPPPIASNRKTGAFLGWAGVALVIGVVVVLATKSSPPSAATTTTSQDPPITSSVPTPSTSTTEADVTTTAVPGPMFDLRSGDVLISGPEGVRIARQSEVVGRAVTDVTQQAFATGDGRVVYQAPPDGVYPDYWPNEQPSGAPEVLIVSPDGTVETLYLGGGSIRMFDVRVIPGVDEGPSVIAMRLDPLADGTHVESLLAIPVDGSPAVVAADVPAHVTGAAWLGDFFVISVNQESGDSYLVAIGLDGDEVSWANNPEAAADRVGSSSRIGTVTRIGDSDLIAYVVSSGGIWEGSTDLVIYDTAQGAPVTTIDIGVPQMVVSALHASNDQLAISRIYDTHDVSSWSLVYVPITAYETTGWTLLPLSIPGGGIYSVVS